MILNNLERNIIKNELKEAIKLVKEIGENKIEEAVDILEYHLLDTENHLLRNSIAIALA
ncbi:hypothetical protein QUF73_13670 [Cytobacillus sp. NJ13]|nr:hypothetical protein [Cytobacillus sp. NJ13]